ncbi:MAG: U32 family peptidase C-terminal domain-containing protein [Firmicutes bacterium]|nr:U32 family peptidase C-terminal domain-containing protein [Bacillota bacterium]
MPLPELLAPAGDLEKLHFAYIYGADAAYIGGGEYSLRLNAGFTLPQIKEAVALARSRGKKLYVAVNSFLRGDALEPLAAYLSELAEIGPDALILSDPGVFSLAREYAQALPVHISTQANVTNWRAARFWREMGAQRVILSRELSLAEGEQISARAGIETEVFIHGAMCISFSGRCLLSSFMTGRSANLGNCSHPCRYKYVLEEEKRPGEYYPIAEDDHGSYIMNSRDLCLLAYIPTLCRGGFSSLKIEGRNKSAYYVANCVRVYRAALDAYAADPEHYVCDPRWYEELQKVSHRRYTEAFAEGPAAASSMRYDDGGYVRGYDFAAVLRKAEAGSLLLEQRNHIAIGDELEIILPDGGSISVPVGEIYDEDGLPLAAANHPRQLVRIPFASQWELDAPLILRRPAR